MRKTIALLTLAAFGAGCSFVARDADSYKKDTRKVLETRNGDVKACYDQQLASDPSQAGEVVVNFTVEKKTGKFTAIQVDPNKSTAPESLQGCVVSALEGLKLAPEDRRDGQATFTWVFNGKPAA